HGGNTSFASYPLRERHLIAGLDHDFLLGDGPAARSGDVVATQFLETLRQTYAIVEIPASICPIRCRDANADRLVRGPGLPPRFEYLRYERHTPPRAGALFLV